MLFFIQSSNHSSNKLHYRREQVLGMNVIQLLMFASFVLVSGCKKQDNPIQPAIDNQIPSLPGWKLVWNDEFKGTSLDMTKWSHEVNGDGGGNNELQYYTADLKNSHVDTGYLVITALKETYLGKEYTSARMRTKGKGDWKYGRFDIRAKLPYGQGLWPAIWMLPTDWVYGGWPASGEIDIMEMLGQETRKIYGTIHYGTTTHLQTGGNYTLPNGTFAGDFHVFTVEWDSLGMKWFVDGLEYFSASHGTPFDQRFHILLNVAVGGNWPGSPDEFTTFPQSMIVDYVRVYAKDE